MSKTRFRAILVTDKVPYLLTIVFISIGWCLNHSVSRLLESPIIEYEMIDRSDGDERTIRYILTNISRDKLFKNLIFAIRSEGGQVSQPGMRIPAPVFVNPDPEALTEDDEQPYPSGGSMIYKIPALHPGWQVEISVKVFGGTPTLRFSSGESVRLLASSSETFVIKHELKIIIVLMLFWVVLLGAYLLLLTRPSEAQPVRQESAGLQNEALTETTKG